MNTEQLFNFDLHPPLSGFPVALFTMTILLEVLSLRRSWEWLSRCAAVCLFAGAVFALGAFLSGLAASEHANRTFQVPDDAISWHYTIGRLLLFCAIPTVALKLLSMNARYGRAGFQAAYLVSLVVCVGLTLYTGHLGGELVFAHGAGVYAPLPQPSPVP